MSAGTVMGWMRIVAVVARAGNWEARVPAARARLTETAVSDEGHRRVALVMPVQVLASDGRAGSGEHHAA